MVAVSGLRTVASERVRLGLSEKAGEKAPLSPADPAPGGLLRCWDLEGLCWFVTSGRVWLEAPLPWYQLGLGFPAVTVTDPVSYSCFDTLIEDFH